MGSIKNMKHWRRFRKRFALLILMIVMIAGTAFTGGPPLPGGEVPLKMSFLRPAPPGVTGAEIFAKLLEHNHLRDAQLERYSVVRTYQVTNDQGKLYATEIVRMRYLAPDHKHFSIRSAEGSWLVRDLVLKRLIKGEAKAASGAQHRDTSLKPTNYSFKLLGTQDVGPYRCDVVQALPKREDKHLFEGKIWIDSQDYGVVRIAGHPAAKLSFWIEHADFVMQYQRLGEFWLPWKDESTVHVRLAGVKILTIVHQQYTVNGHVASWLRASGQPKPQSNSAPISQPSGVSELGAPLRTATDGHAALSLAAFRAWNDKENLWSKK
jgi:hypothetical protein